ncbi:MAG: Dabb family protein [Pirellulales bacterium]|nr:Dabb family protein [Pirellulales bacterium]
MARFMNRMYHLRLKSLLASIAGLLVAAVVCRAEPTTERPQVLRHAVFVKFKEGTSEAEIRKVVSAFDALPKNIREIQGYQRGTNESSAGYTDGFTHCFLLTFADEAGRAKYLPHEEHKAFVEVLKPHMETAFVLDYWGTPAKEAEGRLLKHAVFLKFREGVTTEQVKAVEQLLAELPGSCPSVKAFEWGTNNSPEKLNDGFTHCFMLTFADPAGLNAFAATPAHAEAVAQVMALAEKGRILDFWTQDR